MENSSIPLNITNLKQLVSKNFFLVILISIPSAIVADYFRVPLAWMIGPMLAISIAALMGIMAGFTTMVGNLAGAFSNIYFLAIKLPKNEFIGTAAWLFFIINLFKVPFHIWSWGTISYSSFQISMSLIPGVFVGFSLGIFIFIYGYFYIIIHCVYIGIPYINI